MIIPIRKGDQVRLRQDQSFEHVWTWQALAQSVKRRSEHESFAEDSFSNLGQCSASTKLLLTILSDWKKLLDGIFIIVFNIAFPATMWIWCHRHSKKNGISISVFKIASNLKDWCEIDVIVTPTICQGEGTSWWTASPSLCSTLPSPPLMSTPT